MPTQPADLLEDDLEGLTADELHGEEMEALVLADAEDRHDVGMVQPRRRAGLAAEPLEIGGAGQVFRGMTLRATLRPSVSWNAS